MDSILKKRNEEIANTNAEIEKNNKRAEENFLEAQRTAKETHILANKIILEAEAKAQKQEDETIKNIHQEQKKAIEEILSKQKEEFSQKVLDQIAVECAEIVLQKIGMKPTKQELEALLK